MDNIRLVAGILFTFVFFLFLALAFFVDRKQTQSRWAILRIVSALCAGAAAAFFTGEAVFRILKKPDANTEFFVAGTAGVALFFAVWYGFGRYMPEKPEPPPDSVSFSIPEGWTFSQAAQALVQSQNSLVKFEGFTDAELGALLASRQLDVATLSDGLRLLGDLTVSKPISRYKVSYNKPTYTLTVSS